MTGKAVGSGSLLDELLGGRRLGRGRLGRPVHLRFAGRNAQRRAALTAANRLPPRCFGHVQHSLALQIRTQHRNRHRALPWNANLTSRSSMDGRLVDSFGLSLSPLDQKDGPTCLSTGWRRILGLGRIGRRRMGLFLPEGAAKVRPTQNGGQQQGPRQYPCHCVR